MEDGPERDIEAYVLEQIHGRRGLTHYLENYAGINGKHLKMGNLEDMPLTRWLRIMLWKAKWQGQESFMLDMMFLSEKIVKLAKKL
jgi:hypothetical protein